MNETSSGDVFRKEKHQTTQERLSEVTDQKLVNHENISKLGLRQTNHQ